MQIELRDYQQKIVKSLRQSMRLGNKKVIVYAPTGAG
jgi:superfamily II DNA or RNA helicase|tara:strand:- start:46 stop:156 length:111 start_codon:yes stop_codon:yes gene_type:complete